MRAAVCARHRLCEFEKIFGEIRHFGVAETCFTDDRFRFRFRSSQLVVDCGCQFGSLRRRESWVNRGWRLCFWIWVRVRAKVREGGSCGTILTEMLWRNWSLLENAVSLML